LPYTWDNGWFDNANVRFRLDRVVADPAWSEMFSDVRVRHLILSRSDHCSVLMELRRDAWETKGARTFRYEIMWERVETLSVEIKKVWCSMADKENLGGLVYALRNMQKALRHWSMEQFGAVFGELNDLRKLLEEVKSRVVVCQAEVRAITDRMDELLY
jgi:hypothetical protein